MLLRDKELRVAVIGYGLAGSAFHAPVIDSTAGLKVAAIVTANPERSARARSEFPGAAVVRSAEELWNRPDALDLVVVASPNRTHVPLARAALQAGLPVVVDKPLAPSIDEARALVAEARQRGLVLSVFHNRRWDGDFLTLRRLIGEGALGTVHRLESRLERWRPQPKPGWRQSGDTEDAGGLLFDLGPHLIDQSRVLFGPVTEVYAELDRRYPGADVDDDSFVALTHASGVRSHLWMSTVAASRGPRFRALGNSATYTKFGEDVQEGALRVGHRPGDEKWGEEPEELWGRLEVDGRWEAVRTERGDYRRFYEGIAASLRDGAAPPVDPEDAIAGLAVIAAARRSARDGVVVRDEYLPA